MKARMLPGQTRREGEPDFDGAFTRGPLEQRLRLSLCQDQLSGSRDAQGVDLPVKVDLRESSSSRKVPRNMPWHRVGNGLRGRAALCIFLRQPG